MKNSKIFNNTLINDRLTCNTCQKISSLVTNNFCVTLYYTQFAQSWRSFHYCAALIIYMDNEYVLWYANVVKAENEMISFKAAWFDSQNTQISLFAAIVERKRFFWSSAPRECEPSDTLPESDKKASCRANSERHLSAANKKNRTHRKRSRWFHSLAVALPSLMHCIFSVPAHTKSQIECAA